MSRIKQYAQNVYLGSDCVLYLSNQLNLTQKFLIPSSTSNICLSLYLNLVLFIVVAPFGGVIVYFWILKQFNFAPPKRIHSQYQCGLITASREFLFGEQRILFNFFQVFDASMAL